MVRFRHDRSGREVNRVGRGRRGEATEGDRSAGGNVLTGCRDKDSPRERISGAFAGEESAVGACDAAVIGAGSASVGAVRCQFGIVPWQPGRPSKTSTRSVTERKNRKGIFMGEYLTLKRHHCKSDVRQV
jgi:hypothetical protein